jgi:hypothetical protein
MMWKVGDLVRFRHPLGSLHLAIVIDMKSEFTEVFWIDSRYDRGTSYIRDRSAWELLSK